MRLILARHGETAHNATGFVQGRADNPLNALGQRQAVALAAALSGERLAAVVASPLRRARDTATAIALHHGMDLIIEPDLMEMDVGEMEGLSGPEMRQRFPEFMQAWTTAEGPQVPMPGGESLAQVQQRGWAAVERLHAAFDDAVVVAVTHNFVLAGIVCRAIGVPLDSFRRFRHNVACRTVIDINPQRTIVRRLNDGCHLFDAGLTSRSPWEGPLSRSARGQS